MRGAGCGECSSTATRSATSNEVHQLTPLVRCCCVAPARRGCAEQLDLARHSVTDASSRAAASASARATALSWRTASVGMRLGEPIVGTAAAPPPPWSAALRCSAERSVPPAPLRASPPPLWPWQAPVWLSPRCCYLLDASRTLPQRRAPWRYSSAVRRLGCSSSDMLHRDAAASEALTARERSRARSRACAPTPRAMPPLPLPPRCAPPRQPLRRPPRQQPRVRAPPRRPP